jgi:hypothetical protein
MDYLLTLYDILRAAPMRTLWFVDEVLDPALTLVMLVLLIFIYRRQQ